MRSSLIEPVIHVRPARNQRSVWGVSFRVSSFLGKWSLDALNTFVSTPRLVSDMVGFIQRGPIFTRTFDGSGPPSDVLCAAAGDAPRIRRPTTTRNVGITQHTFQWS